MLRTQLGISAICVFLALISVCLVASCIAPRRAELDTYNRLHQSPVLGLCRDATDSSYVLDNSALFALLDTPYWETELQTAQSMAAWQQRIEDYKAVRGLRWWQEISERIAYCRAQCATSIVHPDRDVRWDVVIRHGIPSVEWSAPGGTADQDPASVCHLYVYTWHEWGREIVCKSAPGGDYPNEITSPGGSWLRSAMDIRIESSLQFSVFPDSSDGTFDVWVSSLTIGDQFTPETLEKGELSLEFLVCDSTGALAGRDSLRAKLDLLRAFAGVTYARDLGVTGYLACRGLPPGTYAARVLLYGAGRNTGNYRKQIRLPSPYTSRGTSDILLQDRRSASGPNVVPGIARGERQLYVAPLARFRRGDTLHPYMEFRVPPENDGQCKVRVVAVPIPGRTQKPKKAVSVGPIAHVVDTAGREWGTSTLPAFDDTSDTDRQKREVDLFEGTLEHAADGGRFETAVPLSHVKRGRYWLAVRVTDTTGARSYGSAWTPIEVW